ncbi:HET domain containing protein [Pyrenophora tritici-repentis]|uniref:HET domain containing protein n=1 Tax=Pyrenophora tritici-repentis TaxID=45151 RepID=A0A2W1FRH0_9PLEO|nr:HET domain-containing protein [Pyrenophora tritici-repentis]KAF7443031.1 HET domain containing protein [Pyrenophora tritici-repentis]KAF7568502.1 HET domain containing protein [Pyrenophora tritici-repentis]KAG9376543.1 HET domain containing protein [Pyrenophora tritici-repentis]KAI0569460.1 HET domain-containing protein [Pyrenophora tritici-repentis]
MADNTAELALSGTSAAPRDADIGYIGDNLFRLSLTRENKAEIFEYGMSKLDQGQPEAELMLRNLTTWCPDVVGQFSPRSSETILDTPFRLIFPNHHKHGFDNGLYVRQYLAISYCWHVDDFPYPQYTPHDHWPFSKPIVDAILRAKGHPREGIWIDQICIDQNDSVDKQRSVAAMDVIYRSCRRLLILLEDVELTNAEARLSEVYNLHTTASDRSWLPGHEARAEFLSFYKKVNKARWWTRAWCLHEFNTNEPWTDRRQCDLLRNAMFIMNGPGDSTVKMEWINLQLIMSAALDLLPIEAKFGSMYFQGWTIFTGFINQDASRVGDDNTIWRPSIMSGHNGVAQKGCQNPADRISIMLNMGERALAYTGEALNRKEEVLYLSALLALAAGETYPLSMMDSRPLNLNGRDSWLSQSIASGETVIPRFRLGGVQGIHQISKQKIELDLIFFDRPLITVNDEDHFPPTYNVFPGIIPITYPEMHVTEDVPESQSAYSPKTQSASDNDQYRRRFLAACILNGHDFTARLWEQLKREVVKPNYNQGAHKDLAPNQALRIPAQRLLEELGAPITENTPTPSVFNAEEATFFLTWVTDPRSMYYVSFTLPLRVQCTIDGRQAMMTSIFRNENYNSGPLEDLRIAIPTDLVNVGCIPLRFWILRPVNDDNNIVRWKIAAKAMLLGEPDLMEELRLNGDKEDAAVTIKRLIVEG